MTDRKYKLNLHGWDDEKVYFVDETGKEWCVNDHPDLLAQLMQICQGFFAQEQIRRNEVELGCGKRDE